MTTAMPLKAIVIDDEPNAVSVLEILLESHCPNVKVVATTTKSMEGVKLIRQFLPEIVFLDIQMPQLNGFQLLEQLEDLQFGVVFTTAYDEFAIRAFKHSAIDFLLKPIDADDLVQAISKVKNAKRQSGQLQLLQQSIKAKGNLPERIALPGLKSIVFENVADIVYCEAYNTNTNFILANRQSVMISKSLGEYENILGDEHFFRIHSHYLINTKRIKEPISADGGFVMMDNGAELPISQNKRMELLEFLSI